MFYLEYSINATAWSIKDLLGTFNNIAFCEVDYTVDIL